MLTVRGDGSSLSVHKERGVKRKFVSSNDTLLRKEVMMVFMKVVILSSIALLVIAAVDDQNRQKRGLSVLTVGCKGDSCPKAKNQAKDTFRPASCLDYLLQGASKCGIYKLYDNAGNSYPAYCDLKSEPGTAWTLVMSWANTYRKLPAFLKIPFKYNAPVNENSLYWNLYRLSLARMRSLQSHSTHWRATCSYPTHGVDFRDYVRGNFKEFNIVDFLGSGKCKKVEYVNIRGHMGMHLTARFWQNANSHTLHIDSSHSGCQFDPRSGAVSSEDNFGYHWVINPKFRCTAGPDSTTQWWFGGHL